MKKKLAFALTQIIILLLALIIIFPLIYGLLGSQKAIHEFSAPTLFPKEFFNTEAYGRVFTKVPMTRYLLNSLIVAVITILGRMCLSVPAAWAFVMYDFRGKKLLFILCVATMMLPADTLIVTNYRTIADMNLTNTYLGMAVTSFVGASTVFMLRQAIRGVPVEMWDTARLDGCSDLNYIMRVLLPMLRPVLTVLILQIAIASWNNYMWPLMVTDRDNMRTVQIGISMLSNPQQMDYPLVLAGVVISVLPIFFLFLILRKRISEAMTEGAVVG